MSYFDHNSNTRRSPSGWARRRTLARRSMKACAPVFVGLTAYDTERIKEMYLESDTAEVADKKAVLGALALYLDFINLFMMLLQLFGQRREN